MVHANIETVFIADDDRITLTAYTAGRAAEMPYNEKRPAVLVFPGGGYSYCSDREGDPIAASFLAAGYNVFVLEYSTERTTQRRFPNQLIEAALSMKFIRDNAEKYAVDPKRIFVIGFSAGAHLAGCLGIMYSSKYVTDNIDMPENYAKPTGMILSYPVITSGEYAHRGSFEHLLGDKQNDEELLSLVSLEKQVNSETVPAYIWHTAEDGGVPVENSLLFASALSKHKVPFELHVFPYGGHGASLGNEIVGRSPNELCDWFSEALHWMTTIK